MFTFNTLDHLKSYFFYGRPAAIDDHLDTYSVGVSSPNSGSIRSNDYPYDHYNEHDYELMISTTASL